MAVNVRIKRRVIITSGLLCGLLVACLGFVFYFMHSFYEAEQFLDPEEVPAPARMNFIRLFPGVTDAEWKFSEDFYEAMFTWEGRTETEAYFHPDGTWAKSEYQIDHADLPPKAADYLAAQEGVKVADLQRAEMPDNVVTYEVELSNLLMEWDCIFDHEGNLLSRTRDGSPLEE